MGIFGALTTAVTGMRAQAFALENVSGNIANSQTTAFKRVDTSFVDLIPDEQPSKQLAGNVVANSRFTNTVQGDIQTSSIGTFMAINGDGFFVIQKPANFVDNRPVFDGVERYSRRGDFQPDKNGYLVNGAGYYLMGIPVDPTSGNLVGSVPQLLQFQNDFLPAQPTSQIEYRANLASYPLTAAHDVNIPKSELLDPALFSANPIAGAPVAAKLAGTGAQLADVVATVTGSGTFATAATALGGGNGGTLRITATPSGGVPTNYDLAFLDTATLTDVMNDINAMAGLSSAVVASIDSSGGTNKLVLTASSADFDFAIGTVSTDALTTRLGLSEIAHASSNLMTSGVAQGEVLTVTVGANTFDVTFGTGVGEVSTVAELATALAAYPVAMGTAAVDFERELDVHRKRQQHGCRQSLDDRDEVRNARVHSAAGERDGYWTGRDGVSRSVDRGRCGHRVRHLGLPGQHPVALGEDGQRAVRRYRHLEPVLSGRPDRNGHATCLAERRRQLLVRSKWSDESDHR